MDKKIEGQLLDTMNLSEFRKIIYENSIISTDELSKEAKIHYDSLYDANNSTYKDGIHTEIKRK